MVVSKKITKYKVTLHGDSHLHDTSGLVSYYSKHITLTTIDGWWIRIRFYETMEKGGDLPDNNTQVSQKQAYAYRRHGDFIPFLDVLRNEKPVFWVAGSDATVAHGSVVTDDEEVGEEEFDPATGAITPDKVLRR